MKLIGGSKNIFGRKAVLCGATGVALSLAAILAFSTSSQGNQAQVIVDGAPNQDAPVGAVPISSSDTRVELAALASGLPDVASATYDDSTGSLAILVKAPSVTPPASIEPSWEANLLAGAFADALAEIHPDTTTAEQIAKMDVTVEAPNGDAKDLGGGIGNAVRDQTFDPRALDGVTVDEIAASSGALGAVPVSISKVQTFAGSEIPIVKLVAANPTRTLSLLTRPDAWRMVLGGVSPYALEGYLVEVDDSAGNPVLVSGGVNRSALGLGWARSDVAPAEWHGLPSTDRPTS